MKSPFDELPEASSFRQLPNDAAKEELSALRAQLAASQLANRTAVETIEKLTGERDMARREAFVMATKTVEEHFKPLIDDNARLTAEAAAYVAMTIEARAELQHVVDRFGSEGTRNSGPHTSCGAPLSERSRESLTHVSCPKCWGDSYPTTLGVEVDRLIAEGRDLRALCLELRDALSDLRDATRWARVRDEKVAVLIVAKAKAEGALAKCRALLGEGGEMSDEIRQRQEQRREAQRRCEEVNLLLRSGAVAFVEVGGMTVQVPTAEDDVDTLLARIAALTTLCGKLVEELRRAKRNHDGLCHFTCDEFACRTGDEYTCTRGLCSCNRNKVNESIDVALAEAARVLEGT